MGVLNRMESMHRNFFNDVDNNDRKLTMIAIYGDRGALDSPGILKKVGDEEQTLFWEDSWLSDPPLKNIFPRLYALEINKHASVAAKFRDTLMSASFRRVPRGGLEEDQFKLLVDKVSLVILFSIKDRWVWILDSGGEFLVKSARSYIDDYLLSIVGPPTRWVYVIPIKINIFAWRISLDRDLFSPSFSCNVARLLLFKVACWWELDIQDFHSYVDWLSWFNDLRLSKGHKSVLE
nr:RNA-directed DNA polymerase, eukaryota [Tanacetum cinerariifolium]